MASFAIVPERRVNKALILEHMIQRFAGQGVRMSLRGDLSRVMGEIGLLPGACCSYWSDAVASSRQQEASCSVEFPLETLETFTLIRDILHRVGVRRNLWEIVIEDDETILFVAYDNWDENCGYVHHVSEEEMWELVDSGLLRHFGHWKGGTFVPVVRDFVG